MRGVKQIQIKKKHYKNVEICYIGYITIKKIDDCENLHSVNSLYFLVNHANGYIEENNGKKKYLIFDHFVNENKELLKYMQMFGVELKTKSKQ